MNYIDLGLPDGTLWADKNAGGFVLYDEACGDYGTSLPTERQFDILVENTDKYWDIENAGVWFRSRINGNAVFFPALGSISTGMGPIGQGSACSYLSRDARLYPHPAGYQKAYRGKKVRWVCLLNIHSMGVSVAYRWLGGIPTETPDNEYLCIRLCKSRDTE